MSKHLHTCDCCGDKFECEEPRVKSCSVAQAAKANHAGPYCMTCYHGIMFARHAGKRADYFAAIVEAYEMGRKRPATADAVITGSQVPQNEHKTKSGRP